MEDKIAFQDHYDDAVSHCYGCGRLNEHGLQIKSYWEGDEAVCRFRPKPYHVAIPGYVYGGLIASLIDCHSTGTAAAAAYRAEGRSMDSEPRLRFVTGSLQVDYLRPTPINATLVVRAQIREMSSHKVVVESTLYARTGSTPKTEETTARGTAICVRMPDHWLQNDAG